MKIRLAYLLIAISGTMVCCAPTKQFSLMYWKIGTTLPQVDNKPAPGIAGPVTGIHNNMLIVAGGANFPDSMPWLGGKKKYHNEVYVFVEGGDKTIMHKTTCFLPFNIAYSASASSEEGIVFVGGENENGISNQAWLLQWDKDRDTIIHNPLPDLPAVVTNAAATITENAIYIAGGETDKGPSDQFYRLDLKNKAAGWQALPPVPKQVSHAVLLVQNKQGKTYIYLAGGRRKNSNGIGELYNSLYEFDLQSKAWIAKKPLPYALSAGTAVAASKKFLVLFGGDRGETFHQSEIIAAAINKEQQEIKKQQLTREKILIQSTHPGFSNEILVYDVLRDDWSVAGNIPFQTPVTTTASTWKNLVVIPSGEIKAGVRTPQILLAEFAFNDD